jgi:epoxyqueuosine reductase
MDLAGVDWTCRQGIFKPQLSGRKAMKAGETVRAWAAARGYRAAVGSVSLLEEVRGDLQRRRDAAEIDAAFFRENLESFDYLGGVPLKNPRSLIIVAVPAPAYVLAFTVGDKRVEAVLPPTYVRYRTIFTDVRDDLRDAISGSGSQVELLSVPLKALGSRLGLLAYGRNNVGYIDGLGSYFQLVGLVSDMPLDGRDAPSRREETLLPRCRKCRICAAACPMGAIDKERVLLHGEKCYTLYSESPKPIPEGLEPPSPGCIIGCLRCQELCPENKGQLRYENAAVSFDAKETEAFLGLEPAGSGPAFERARAKFQQLGLSEGLFVFRRNLSRLIRGGTSLSTRGRKLKTPLSPIIRTW